MMPSIVRVRRAPWVAAALSIFLIVAPEGSDAQSDADKAATLRDTAVKLREAAEAAERAAGLLEAGDVSSQAQQGATVPEADSDGAQGREAASKPAAPGTDEDIVFLHPLDNKPIEFDFRPDQEITAQVTKFKETGDNPYSGDQAAVQEGQKLYTRLCQACHLKDGTGRIGPNLTDDQHKYPRTDTDVGMFEIIYAGGAGAMQAFGRRIDQDDILKLMAYVETFQEK